LVSSWLTTPSWTPGWQPASCMRSHMTEYHTSDGLYILLCF
jgi:hypothetical protein